MFRINSCECLDVWENIYTYIWSTIVFIRYCIQLSFQCYKQNIRPKKKINWLKKNRKHGLNSCHLGKMGYYIEYERTFFPMKNSILFLSNYSFHDFQVIYNKNIYWWKFSQIKVATVLNCLVRFRSALILNFRNNSVLIWFWFVPTQPKNHLSKFSQLLSQFFSNWLQFKTILIQFIKTKRQ